MSYEPTVMRTAQARLERRRERREQRLKDIGYSQADFDIILEERKRSSYTVKKRPVNQKMKRRSY